MLKAPLQAASLSAMLLASTAAWGFCGFYVATESGALTNRASKVVLVRDQRHTEVTMASDVHGDPKQFALVIPVPTVIRREQVHVVKPETVGALEQYTKPRLVEYFDESPCVDRRLMALPAPAPMATMMRRDAVQVEAAYSVEEYDIQVLRSDRGDALVGWLNENGYTMPAEAAPIVSSYIGQGMHFFVAKVNLERMKGNTSGMLRPIRVAYDTPKFMLPIRLGTVNATGPQDMIVMALSTAGRVEVTNYRTERMPTGMDVPEYVRGEFPRFYDAVFERAVAKAGGAGVFEEYAWPISTGTAMCDPCTGPTLSQAQMAELGADWPAGGAAGFVTRLHVRYDRAHFPEDLQFQETPDRGTYQARYVIHRHEIPPEQLTCNAGGRYAYAERPAAWRREQDNAVALTGWDRGDVAKAISDQWARDRPK